MLCNVCNQIFNRIVSRTLRLGNMFLSMNQSLLFISNTEPNLAGLQRYAALCLDCVTNILRNLTEVLTPIRAKDKFSFVCFR